MTEIGFIAVALVLVLYVLLRFVRSANRSKTLHQFAVFVVAFALFLIWAPWISAMPRETALKRYPDLDIPKDWEVVVVGHGVPTRWYLGTVQDNPIGFVLCVAAFVGCLFYFHRITKRGHLE